MKRSACASLVLLAVLAAPGVAAAQDQIEATDIRPADTSASLGPQFTGGGELYVGVRGTATTDRVIEGILLPPSSACPTTRPGASDNELRSDVYTVNGPFDLDLLSPIVFLEPWRVCVYLLDSQSDPPAVVTMADRVVEPEVAPINADRPTATITGLATRLRYECSGGAWLAWPKPKVRYAWKVRGRRVRGATKRSLRTRARRGVACGVTVTNEHGTKTVWSKAARL